MTKEYVENVAVAAARLVQAVETRDNGYNHPTLNERAAIQNLIFVLNHPDGN